MGKRTRSKPPESSPEAESPPMPDGEVDESLFPSQEDFNDAQGIWDEGKEETERGRPVGQFQARIAVAELGRSSSSNRLQIHYELEILAGEYEGVVLHKYDGLATAQQASISQQQLKRLGVDTAGLDIPTLPAQLLELVDENVVITCRQNGEFHNIYFNRRMSEGIADSPPQTQSRSAASGRTQGRSTATGRRF